MPRCDLTRAKVRPCSCQGAALLVPKEFVKARPRSCQRNLPRRCLTRAKGICQGAALLVLKKPACANVKDRNCARAKAPLCSHQGTCQGPTVLVPKESAKARPCSCQRNMPVLMQRITIVPVPRRHCAPAKERAKERAKAQPCLCQGPRQGATVLPAKECAKKCVKAQPCLC
ncbi:hypothetical protein Scep_027983 [Stephania cephalantha]|uniref:Uncharacterized protein n=1 Tax=Stephania cephalantha TaxID=152367 RepID=A0AAP0E932_9MAGN